MIIITESRTPSADNSCANYFEYEYWMHVEGTVALREFLIQWNKLRFYLFAEVANETKAFDSAEVYNKKLFHIELIKNR